MTEWEVEVETQERVSVEADSMDEALELGEEESSFDDANSFSAVPLPEGIDG